MMLQGFQTNACDYCQLHLSVDVTKKHALMGAKNTCFTAKNQTFGGHKKKTITPRIKVVMIMISTFCSLFGNDFHFSSRNNTLEL